MTGSTPAAPAEAAGQETAAPQASEAEAAPEVEAAAQDATESDAPQDERTQALALVTRAIEEREAAKAEAPPAAEGEAAEAPAAEAKPEGKPEEKPPSLAAGFAALKEAERRFRMEREAAKADIEAAKAFAKLKAEVKANPLKALEALGVDYTAVTEHVLSGGKQDPVAEVKAQLAALQAERERERAEAQQRQVEAAVSTYKATIAAELKAQAATYELAAVKGEAAVDMAYAAIDAYVAQYGEFPGGSPTAAVQQALQHVEAELEKEASAYLTANKLRAKLSPAAATKSVEAPSPRAKQGTQRKTLTNAQASVAPPRREPESLSREELVARAARILNGESA